MISRRVDPEDQGSNQRGRKGPLTGRLLGGRWRLGELLGQGGMSSVYAATHRNGKQFAIKVLRPDLSDRERTKWRFLREGYIANRVGHEGVVTVLDDITENGVVFLVMELLEGITVEQYCCERGGTVPTGEVLAIADGVLDILVAAHAKGVVHRDIKPSNLFLTSEQKLKLLDFGIASVREAPGVANATINGALLGTPGFMAPEQARGRWKEIDARTDVWGVGALMFRLLTGRLVHETETTHESVVLAATQPAQSIGSIEASLPDNLVALVDRALASDPRDRWQNAMAMQVAVRAEQRRLPSSALPRPSRRATAATLDEPRSVAGTASELPNRLESAASKRLARSPRWWVSSAGGALGAVLFLWIIGGRAERASPARPMASSALTSQERTPPLATSTPPPVAVASTAPTVSSSPFTTPFTTAQTIRGAASSSIPRRMPTSGPGNMKPSETRAAPASAAVVPTAPRRLEDVLDERK
jgi:eukaryotic-like serine/threonine-protein kinase